MIEEPIWRRVVLDLVLTNKKELIGNVKLKVSLDSSDHEMVELEILGAVSRGHNKLTVLDSRIADFGLFRDSSGVMHPSKEEVRQKYPEVHMDKQEAPG